jgi:predicted nucleic acid-binding protein
MIFVDSSAYIGILNPLDNNHKKAVALSNLLTYESQTITSYAVLGEVLTVGSMRYNRKASIDFVRNIFKSKTEIVSENDVLTKKAFKIFQEINDKDVGWVDCYSFAIIDHFKIEKVFSFDKDFRKYAKSEILKQ